jgi:hypothetical protein
MHHSGVDASLSAATYGFAEREPLVKHAAYDYSVPAAQRSSLMKDAAAPLDV